MRVSIGSEKKHRMVTETHNKFTASQSAETRPCLLGKLLPNSFGAVASSKDQHTCHGGWVEREPLHTRGLPPDSGRHTKHESVAPGFRFAKLCLQEHLNVLNKELKRCHCTARTGPHTYRFSGVFGVSTSHIHR